MTEVIIRPTAKFLMAGAIAAAAVVLGVEIACLVWMQDQPYVGGLQFAAPLLLLWPAARWLRRQFTKTVLAGDRLRYETGITSRSTRIIQLSKIQDVRMDQSLSQRLFAVGNVSIETAGETSRLTIFNVDDPHKVADEVMTASQKGNASA